MSINKIKWLSILLGVSVIGNMILMIPASRPLVDKVYKRAFRLLGIYQEPKGYYVDIPASLPREWIDRSIIVRGNNARLKRVFEKASLGERIVIGMIGGSITEGAHASVPAKHFSAYVAEWFALNFPAARVYVHNAGFRATGSIYGVARAERDLLAARPELAIIEFAVNDRDFREESLAYEGLVRKILSAPGEIAVVQLFMTTNVGVNSQAWKAKIGDHYQLPSVSFHNLVYPEIQKGKLAWRDLSPDHIHPNDRGHEYAGKMLCAFLQRELIAAPDHPTGKELPKPLFGGEYERTELLEADSLRPVRNSGWELVHQNKQNGIFYAASKKGSAIEFEIQGRKLFLSYLKVIGRAGKARVFVDDKETATIDSWFHIEGDGYRENDMIFNGSDPGNHRVRVEVLSERNPASRGNDFRILGMIAAGKEAR